MRFAACLLVLTLLSGCGPGLTRAMWTAPLPDPPPQANRASRIGHRVGRVVVVAGRTVATPVTVVADVAGEAVSNPEVWYFVGHVVVAAIETGLRASCR